MQLKNYYYLKGTYLRKVDDKKQMTQSVSGFFHTYIVHEVFILFLLFITILFLIYLFFPYELEKNSHAIE